MEDRDGGRIVTLPGGDLQVREDGRPRAPAIGMIHGWTASIHWWDRITPLLAKRYHVVRVDLLGHGGSAKPKNGEVAIALAARQRQMTRALAVVDSEPNERFVDPDLLASLSSSP